MQFKLKNFKYKKNIKNYNKKNVETMKEGSFFISMNEINFAFQTEKKKEKKTFFPVLISFNDLSCDFFHLSFLMYKNFHLFFC